MVYRTWSLGLNKITLLYLAPRIFLTHCTLLLSVYLHTVAIFIPAHFILFSMQIIVVVRSVYTITCFVFLSLQSIAEFSAGFSVSGLQGLSDKRLFNPHSLQPSRCIKEYFWISAEWLNFLHLRTVLIITIFVFHLPPLKPFQAWIYHCHLHPLQGANCCRNSRLVVDEDDLMWVKNWRKLPCIHRTISSKLYF